jgi:hypothetical protein
MVHQGRVGSFRWASALGIGVALLFLNGAINVFFALFVPLSLHAGGPAGSPGLIVSNPADGALIGRSLEEIGRADPRLGAFLVSFMDTMCSMMMAFGILQVAVAWFALRRGAPWALWSSVVANLAVYPYYGVIWNTYARFEVSASDLLMFFIPGTVILIAGTVFGAIGIRRAVAA